MSFYLCSGKGNAHEELQVNSILDSGETTLMFRRAGKRGKLSRHMSRHPESCSAERLLRLLRRGIW